MADPATLRPYQREAIQNTLDVFSRDTRTQLRAACGAGKTVMAIHCIERLHPVSGTVVILCPTLLLVSQTLNAWADHHTASGTGRPYQALIVASDASDTERRFAQQGMALPVTTTVTAISDWLSTPSAGLRIVVGTHRSAGQIGQALRNAGHEADLVVVDEAHHTAGHRDKHTALVHRDDQLPARRRLYLTATPRVLLSSPTSDRADELLSMDSEPTFGRIAFDYPLSRAITEGWLDDYRLVVIGVGRTEVLDHLRTLRADPRTSSAHPIAPHEAAVHIAIARAAAEWDLRRIVAFTPNIAAAARLARDLPITVARARVGPDRPLTSEHITGRHDSTQRAVKLDRLAHPPHEGWTVLANVRVLGEGIDIPAIDAVVFTHPKRSTIDVVQSVGRALRPHPDGPGTATILVPILLPDTPAELQDISDDDSFAALWQVVRALRAHDDLLAADLDRRRGHSGPYRTQPPLARLITRLPGAFDTDTWMRELTVRIVRAGSSSWWEGLGAATRYRDQHGHLDAPPDYVDPETGYRLGAWIVRQRTLRRQGGLPAERAAALDELGMTWDPREQLWSEGLTHAAAWHARRGHLDTRTDTCTDDGFPIGNWLRSRREELGQGKLAPTRAAALSAIDPLWTDPGLRTGLLAADRYHHAHGALGKLRRYRDPDTRLELGRWLQERRHDYHEGVLHPVAREHLDRLGMDWSMPRRQSTQRQLQALARFHAQNGHLRVPPDHRDGDLAVGEWVMRQRYAKQHGRIDPAIAAALDELGMDWHSQSDRAWRDGLAAAQQFHATHGHLRVPRGHHQNGVPLDTWIEERRSNRRRGTLAADRIAALDALGMEWDPRAAQRQAYLDEAQHYLAEAKHYLDEHGDLKVPVDSAAGTLGHWLNAAKRRHKRGTLPAEIAEQLDALDPTWAVPRRRRMAH